MVNVAVDKHLRSNKIKKNQWCVFSPQQLGVEPRILHMLGKHTTTYLLSQLLFYFFDGSGVWTQGPMFATQVLYHLNLASSKNQQF
jgi:hypothetical protein